ncbi:hypothetical protein AGMMS49991_03720 [Spirochaetia bacterium]|nr:hypothetical protein AGMMS49991_03720 [Spirochaetia bacterium]
MLASIHTGSALNVWSSFALEAAAKNMSLFIFPGGQLNSLQDLEYLRNPIFSLVNAENLDGLISWSSTIGNTVSPEEFRAFHASLESLPYVTIAHKVPGHPCVQFDAYNGMKRLTAHFINEHHAQRIAFLRGPETHASALDRLNGYRDALKEGGCPCDETLVTGPVPWANGAAACAQLVEGRHLAPGKDFDALIGSSDMMTFSAIQYLGKQGYSVPGDYLAGGFNNSAESRILTAPLSTVCMPYAELAGESFKILKSLFESPGDSPGASVSDVVLPCDVIIRESCGCRHSVPGEADNTIPAEPLVAALKAGDTARFFELFKNTVAVFLESDQDIDSFPALIEPLKRAAPDRIDAALESDLFMIMARMQEHAYTDSQYRREKWHSALNSLKCELLGTMDRPSLVQSLARHLPKIGIFTALVVLYEDENFSECVGNFSPGGITTAENRRFPASQLFPAELACQYADGIFMVQPLFIENRSLGYFIHNVPFYDGVILEELRSTVSNALKSIFLFEETNRAKQIAEQAERAKTEFFAAIGNNLYDPLAETIDTIEAIEERLAAETGETTIAETRELLRLLKSVAVQRQERISHLIDLSLSQVEDMPFHNSLFNIAAILPELGVQGPFPLLSGDTAQLRDAFSLIREFYGNGVSAKMQYRGLEISFTASDSPAHKNGEQETAAIWTKQTLQLAERVILMHKGELVKTESGCAVILPWITYTGQSLGTNARDRKAGGSNNCVLSLSPLSVDVEAVFGLPVINSLEKAKTIPGRIAFIAWDPEASGGRGHPHDDPYTKAAALRTMADFFHTPFLCFSQELAGETISAAVDAHIQSEKKRTILFIGIDGDLFTAWLDRGSAAHIPSKEYLADAVSRAAPTLIVLDSIDIEAIEAARSHPATAMIPIIVTPRRIQSAEEVEKLCRYPYIVLCNRSVADRGEFSLRVRAIAAGDAILPLYTGALVKKVLLYFNRHAESHISRWKVADSVNVSEDYLTRIFRREMGCSLWEYLNQYRVSLAAELLTHTGDTIYEIAMKTGFQDQAYFCRVFKKIYGKAPGQLRNLKKGQGLIKPE